MVSATTTVVVDPRQSHDSEQILPATIAHHAVYKNKRNLQQNHVCQWGPQLYLVGLLSRLVDKPPFEPSLSNNILPLTTAAYDPNVTISLTQTLDRILVYVYNGRCLGYKKQKNGDRGRIVFTYPRRSRVRNREFDSRQNRVSYSSVRSSKR